MTEFGYNTQTKMILDHLKSNGSITSLEAIQQYGCTRLSACIFKLRKCGYDIENVPQTSKNRYGRNVTFAKYTLRGGKS